MALISVIIPALDEAERLESLVPDLVSALEDQGVDLQILVVDDGSTDATWDVLQRLQESDPRIGGLKLSTNFGKESAIIAGLDHARGDAAIVMDADGQHPISAIPEMLRLWRQGAKVVHGVKREVNRSLVRRAGTAFFYGLTRRLSGLSLHRSSDFKLLDRQVVRTYRDGIRERNRFFRVSAEWIGYTRASFEYDVAPIVGRRSRWSFGALIRLAVRGVTSFSPLPLQLPTVLGVGMVALAVGAGATTIGLFGRGSTLTGSMLVVTTVLTTASVLLLCMGLLGEYVATIHEEVKRRPMYIIEESTDAEGGDDRPGGTSERHPGRRSDVDPVA